MNVTVRAAASIDSEAIARLTRELGYDASVEDAARRLSHLATGGNAVFVAETESAIAGWIHVAEVLSLENDPYAEIRGLVVASGMRGGGIGASLVEAAEQWAREQNLDRIRVRSNVVRVEARRFYERLGYAVTKTQNVFDKRLG